MRTLLLLLLLAPVWAQAQLNRSAKELSKEKIKEYVTTKLLAGKVYKPLAFEDIIPVRDRDPEVVWSIQHRFEAAEQEWVKEAVREENKMYNVTFYLDRKLNIRRAESSQQP
ncbi:MAG TPA: hypothetical protein VHK91_04200 [Flavisolibacter sp.]|jgi:hypothetical protein|nr:hypothetical protein [Flavisolibacter sp.]